MGPLFAFLAIVAFLAVAYGPDLGAGLSKDDFAWIASSRVSRGDDLLRLFTTTPTGFYRPLVHLTFTANHALFGVQSAGYAWTNLALAVSAAAAVYALARTQSMPWGASVAAAALWAANPHGINMATLWVSGRTALVVTNMAVVAAIFFIRRRPVWSAAFCLLAMLAKEEALVLPAVLVAWAVIDDRLVTASSRGVFVRRLAPFAVVTVVYLLLRLRSGAITPATAPDFYRPTLEVGTILRNALEYLDRGATFALVMAVMGAVAAGALPRLDERERRIAWKGIAWFAGGYGLTVLLPVRSSLYACLPSVGAALIAACLLAAAWRRAPPSRRQLVPLVALLPILALPVYWSRNVRYVRDAHFTSRVREALQDELPAIRAGRPVILHDDPASDMPARRAFVFAFPQAVRLWSGNPGAVAWIDPPPPGWQAAGLRPPAQSADAIHLVVEGPEMHRH